MVLNEDMRPILAFLFLFLFFVSSPLLGSTVFQLRLSESERQDASSHREQTLSSQQKPGSLSCFTAVDFKVVTGGDNRQTLCVCVCVV